jgi:hypothetical protein
MDTLTTISLVLNGVLAVVLICTLILVRRMWP